MRQAFEGIACAACCVHLLIGGGVGLGVPGLDELCLGGVGGLLPAKILGPVAEVGEIDIGGEVLPAGVLPDIGAGEALMHKKDRIYQIVD